MIAVENISSRIDDKILFANLNNSFQTGRIHGIWHEKNEAGTAFLKLLAGDFLPDNGWFRYGQERLDHTDVAYYNRDDMPGAVFEMMPSSGLYKDKLIYLFDDVFDASDMRYFLFCYKIILSLKEAGKTILITSTDHKVLTAFTDYFHILSGGVFQATLRFGQYDLLDEVLKHVRRF